MSGESTTQRVQCRKCSRQWMKPSEACPGCGEYANWKAVKPGPGDLQLIEQDALTAAGQLYHLLRSGTRVTYDHPVVETFSAAWRELEWARQGILMR